MLTASQIRAARALLRWTVPDLAEASGVSVPTIARMEQKDGLAPGRPRTLADLKRAFEDAGVEFIGSPDAPGVVLRQKDSD